MPVATDEAGVVVELGKAGQADTAPVAFERTHGRLRAHAGRRPRGQQAAVEGDSGQDVELEAAAQAQPGDDVEAVELELPAPDLGDVPARRWSRPTDPPGGIERTPSLEDPGDRPDGGERTTEVRLALERSTDGHGAVLAEDALFAEHPAQVDDPVFDIGAGPLNAPGDRRLGAPVDLLEGAVSRAIQPQLDRGQADPELARDRPLR